ncbi:DUF3667 domain-containing protein [Winogradskyella sp. 3972H.M.0a.05]|uniref:DUF3667 domain-containing protein n=1 Tax=Winogradskyella sp. 3972H.M.0a.05 TaxID=2950277 RepID=UPI003391786E
MINEESLSENLKSDIKCLNCESEVSGKYCSNCGQQSDVTRYSLRYIVKHDISHGIFHINHGLPYTLKELSRRPGHAIAEFLEGQRKKHFHFFTFIIIAVLTNKVIGILGSFNYDDFNSIYNNDTVAKVDVFIKENTKIITLGVIPLQAAVSFLIFRKSKLNYSEHLIISSYIAGALLFIDLLYPLGFLVIHSKAETGLLTIVVEVLKIAYSIWVFNQFFSKMGTYSKGSTLVRSILSTLLILFLTYTIFLLIVNSSYM